MTIAIKRYALRFGAAVDNFVFASDYAAQTAELAEVRKQLAAVIEAQDKVSREGARQLQYAEAARAKLERASELLLRARAAYDVWANKNGEKRAVDSILIENFFAEDAAHDTQ